MPCIRNYKTRGLGLMDLTVKNGESVFNGEVSGNLATMNSQALKNQRDTLRNELRERMSDGDADGVMRVKNLLRDFADLITATEIKELRRNIDAATDKLAVVKQETDAAEAIKAEHNRILADKIKAAETAGLAVERANLLLYQLDAERDSLLDARRQYNERLQELIQSEITQTDNTQKYKSEGN